MIPIRSKGEVKRVKFDLLYLSDRPELPGDREICRAAKLDEVFSVFMIDAEKTGNFLGVVSSPLTNPDEISYRQEILTDFLDHPGLFERIREVSDEFDRTKRNFMTAKRERMKNSVSGVTGLSPDVMKAGCRVSAGILCDILGKIRTLAGYSSCGVKSRGLSDFFGKHLEFCGKEEFAKLQKLCGMLEYRESILPTDVRIKLGDGGVVGAELCEHHFTLKKPEKRSIFRRKEERAAPPDNGRVAFGTYGREIYEKLAAIPFSFLASELDNASGQLLGAFADLSADLDFYECAISYVGYLKKRGIPVSFPTFGARNIDCLYPPDIIVKCENLADIVPQSIPDTRNIVIYGKNNSGKTVFLTSLAAATLLAQAGLPVPAKGFGTRIYRRIVILFAGGNDDAPKNDAPPAFGGFEEEVRKVAGLVDSDLSDSLVLFNEPFQTTAYKEGAAGLHGLMRYFSRIGADYVITTHMTAELFPLMRDGEAAVLEFGTDHVGRIGGKELR